MADQQAKIDSNNRPTLTGVTDDASAEIRRLLVDPTTGYLKVSVTGGGTGDVMGPASATDNAVARFDGTTGKLIQDSAVIIADTTGNISGAQQLTLGVQGSGTGKLLVKGTTSGTVTIQVAAAAGTYTLTLPTDDGTPSQFLQTDGSGVLTWATPAGSGNVNAASNLTDNAIVRGDGGTTGVQTSGIIIDDTDNVTGMATLTLPNTGLHLLDTNATHDLIIVPGSDLTADRNFTITTGDAARTLSMSGNITTAADFVTSGANSLTLTTTGATNVTLPTSGTLYGTAAGSITSAQLLSSLSDETGTGVVVFSTTPTLVTPVLGVATATSINKVAITAPATSATLTIADGKTLTVSDTMTLAGPNGSGNVVFTTSPTLVTPTLGVASATTINKVTLTAPATGSTLTILDGKTLTVNKSLTLEGTDSTTMTFPTTNATIARTDAGQTFTGVQVMTSPDIATSITTPSASFSIANATATTLNIGGAATTVNFAGGSGAVINLGGGANAAELRFLEPSGGGTNYTAFKAQAQTADLTYTLPAAQGAASTFLQNNGSGTLTWAAASGGASSQTLTDAATISWDINSGTLADVTLAGNRTLANATNIAKNQFTTLTVYQDAVGSRTLAYGTQYQFNGATPVLSTGPLLADIFHFTNDGSNQYATVVTKGFGATFAYFAGGGTTLSAGFSTVTDGLDFSTDTTGMVTKGALSSARCDPAGANSATVGYFAGGHMSGTSETTVTDGLSFATDTTAQVTKGALETARGAAGSANSSTLGYFAGGKTGAGTSDVTTAEGLTFSTDTTTQVTKGALVTKQSYLAGTNSTTVGYFAGGSTGNGAATATTTDSGLTFATDTNAMVTKGVLATAKLFIAAVNSTTIGYYSGGQSTDATKLTDTQALTFSTDTTTMVTKGVLGTATTGLGGANSGGKGYFAGGQTGSSVNVAVCNGLDFSSDTTTMVTKGALSSALEQKGGAQGSKLGLVQIQ